MLPQKTTSRAGGPTGVWKTLSPQAGLEQRPARGGAGCGVNEQIGSARPPPPVLGPPRLLHPSGPPPAMCSSSSTSRSLPQRPHCSKPPAAPRPPPARCLAPSSSGVGGWPAEACCALVRPMAPPDGCSLPADSGQLTAGSQRIQDRMQRLDLRLQALPRPATATGEHAEPPCCHGGRALSAPPNMPSVHSKCANWAWIKRGIAGDGSAVRAATPAVFAWGAASWRGQAKHNQTHADPLLASGSSTSSVSKWC